MSTVKFLIFMALTSLSITSTNAASATATTRMRVLASVDYISSKTDQRIILNKNTYRMIISNKKIESMDKGPKEEIIIENNSRVEVIF